jgi:hypothetical protein
MYITKKHLSRRTFLQSAVGRRRGAAVPRRDGAGLTAQRRTAAAAPFRFGAVYLPNGVFPTRGIQRDRQQLRVQAGDAAARAVSRRARHRQRHEGAVGRVGAPGRQRRLLERHGPVAARDASGDAFGRIQSKKTVDQFIADHVAGDTPLRSLEVGTEDMGTAAGACDGFPCTFFNALAWRDDSSPLPVGINPRVTFERMFGETGSTDQRAKALKQKQSLLDSVSEEASRLQRTLGAKDRAILDEYLSNVRQVEQQLDRMETGSGPSPATPKRRSDCRRRTTIT